MRHDKLATDALEPSANAPARIETAMKKSADVLKDQACNTDTALLMSKTPGQSKQQGLRGLCVRRTVSRQADTRRQSRERLHDVRAEIRYGSRKILVELLNISGGGAMIACDLQPNLGDRFMLSLEGRDTVECLIRWIKGERIGLEFAHETQLQCSDEEQASLLREVVRRTDADELIELSEGPAGADIRSGFRHPLIWSGELVYRQQRRKVRLRNISTGGALVEGPVSPRVGSEVLLDLGGAGLLTGTVRWAAGDCAGLEFDHPFDLASLARAKPRLVPTTWLRPAYLEKVVPETSGWDKGWNRMSLGEVREQLEGYLKH